MIFKSYIVEKDIGILNKCYLVLFYGENIGLKDEIKLKIKQLYKNYEQIILNQDEILKNTHLLNEHILNTSLFSKKKIIIINNFTDKLKNKINEIAEKPKNEVKIFLFSEALEKKSAVRSFFEKDKNSGIVACYQDNEKTLAIYLRNKLGDYQGLSQELINLLINNSGFDRKTLSHEIDKIKRLFTNKQIDQKKLLGLINNTYNIDFDNLKNACLAADKSSLNRNLGNISLQNEDVYFYLNSINLRIQKLEDLHNQIKVDKDIVSALENIKPKIFWKDKPIILKQIKKWNLKKIEDAKKILADTEILIKTKLNGYNSTLIKKMLVELCNKADSSS